MPRIVFCLPGTSYSREFLMAWTDMAMQVATKGHEITMLQFPTIKEVCAALTKTPCDYAMWIGSNVVFDPKAFFELLESPHPATAGYYVDDVPDTVSFRLNLASAVKMSDLASLERYVPAECTKPDWLLVKDGAAFTGSLNDMQCMNGLHIDTSVRIGNQKLVII